MYGEGIVLSQSYMFGSGGPLYHAIGQPPFTITAYTPLYYALVAFLTQFTGPSFLPGRAIALFSLAAAALLVAFAAKKETGWRWGVLGGCFFLAHPFVAEWAGLHRVDTLALALTLAGLLLARREHLAWSAVAVSTAVFTKQTYLAAPAAIVCLLLIQRRYRQAGLFCAVLAAIGASAFAVFSMLSDGQFAQNTIIANINPSYPEYLLIWLAQASPALLPLLALSIVGLVVLPARWNLWKLYFGFTAFNLLALVKEGASYNYFLETFAAGGILSAGVLSMVAARGQAWLARVAVAVVVIAMLPGILPTVGDIDRTWHGREEEQQAVDWAVTQVIASPGPVISEDLGVLALAGKPITYEYVIYSLFQLDGRWSDAGFRAAIEAGAYPRLLLLGDSEPLAGYCDCMSYSTWEELQRNYLEIGRFGKYVLYSTPSAELRQELPPPSILPVVWQGG